MTESIDALEKDLLSVVERLVRLGVYTCAAILATWFAIGCILAVVLTIRSAVQKSRA